MNSLTNISTRILRRLPVSDLTLALKGEYFDAIKSGEKVEEYRLYTEFWEKRIEGKKIDRIILTRGYPKRTDESRRMVLPWRGYEIKEITHPHFGDDPVRVYAIAVNSRVSVSGSY